MQIGEIKPFWMYGTAWKEDETERLTRLAIDQGFRAIDTANQRKHYFEAAVGAGIASAIEAGVVARDELFIQTKFTHQAGQDHRLPYDPAASMTTQVEQSFTSSLEHLGVEFIDSYVLHGPSFRTGWADGDIEVWRAMEGLLADDRVGHIGVSNVSAAQLAELVEMAEGAISFVQNRCFAAMRWDAETRRICDANNIVYQGFSLLTANVREVTKEPIVAIAKKHGATLPQVVFRFAQQVGMLPLTGTTDAEHMAQDLDCESFDLDDAEVDTILAAASV